MFSSFTVNAPSHEDNIFLQSQRPHNNLNDDDDGDDNDDDDEVKAN